MWGRGARFGFTSIGGGEVYWFAVLDAPPGEKDDSPLEARGEDSGSTQSMVGD
jgi:hypothetical protein